MFKVLSVALVMGVAIAPSAIVAGDAGARVIHLAQATTTPAPASPAGEAAAPVDEAALIEQHKQIGEPIYAEYCAGCHQANGRGDIGPSLAGNGKLANAAAVHRQIARGGSEMPAFGQVLTPEEILAVGTYIRNSFGNAYGPLTEENIQAQ